jgi:tetratricopeptide (TPR) repeat protein
MLEDGTPPPEPVLIEKICGSVRRAEAHTDSKGRFSFQIGTGVVNTEQMMDVSAESSRMPGSGPSMSNSAPMINNSGPNGNRLADSTSLQGCELHAALAGYQSRNVNISVHSGLDNPDIGVIILKRLGGRDGDTLSVTNALAPKDAKKAYDKARQLIAKYKSSEARAELTKAVGIYPKYASAWLELGALQMEVDEEAEARQSFQKALEADPKFLPPYERLAVLEVRAHHWQALADTTERLIQLSAYEFPQAYYYNALAHLNLLQPEAAEKSAREALKQDPQKFARAGYVLGLALAQRGEYKSAVEQLKAYLATNPPISDVGLLKEQLADMGKRAERQSAAVKE